MAWTASWPRRRQSRGTFQRFMRAEVCSTRARTLRCEALRPSPHSARGSSFVLRRCGTVALVPRRPPSAVIAAFRAAYSVPDSAYALQSSRLPDSGRPTVTTSWVPASPTTWWSVEYR